MIRGLYSRENRFVTRDDVSFRLMFMIPQFIYEKQKNGGFLHHLMHEIADFFVAIAINMC